MLNTCAAKSPGNHGNHTNLAFFEGCRQLGGVCIGLDSERAGSRTLEKSSRRDRDRDCAKFEHSRQFRGSNMNPKKIRVAAEALASIQALDLAISRFIYSFVYTFFLLNGQCKTVCIVKCDF